MEALNDLYFTNIFLPFNHNSYTLGQSITVQFVISTITIVTFIRVFTQTTFKYTLEGYSGMVDMLYLN